MDSQEPENCDCSITEMRRYTQSNNVVIVVNQCLTCGRRASAVKKKTVANVDSLPRWDEELPKRWNEQRSKFWAEAHQQRLADYDAEKRAKDALWWQRYNAYLQTPEWKALRDKVFKRCNYICEGCGVSRVWQVHHLNYKRVCNEMLFDLVGICYKCHAQIHPDREM